MRQNSPVSIHRIRLNVIVAALAVAASWGWPGAAAWGQTVIDMPPPQRSTPAQVEPGAPADAAAMHAMTDVGQLALGRYGSQRTGVNNTYGMYNRVYRGGWPYGYGYGYGWGYPGFGWGGGYPCYGGGAVVRYVGGGRFVGTLCH